MFTQALASVFSSSGVLFPQRVTPQSQKPSLIIQPVEKMPREAAVVSFSSTGQALSKKFQNQNARNSFEVNEKEKNLTSDSQALTEEEKKDVEELKKRDVEVRRHEQAHMVAAGQYAKGAPQYDFTRGPDDKQYAVGGHVSIDTSPVPDDPEATIQKAQVLKQAATAPAEASGADQQVAAQASQMEQKARMELAKENREKGSGDIHKSRFAEDRILQYGNPEAPNGQLMDLAA